MRQREYWFRLTDTVGSIDRLRFNRGVPPWIDEKDIVRCSKIDADSPGLEADQKKRDVVPGLKLMNSLLPGSLRCRVEA